MKRFGRFRAALMRPILKSTKVSARKPAAAKAKTSNSPSAGKGLPRKARKPGARRRSAPIECSCAYVTIIGPYQSRRKSSGGPGGSERL